MRLRTISPLRSLRPALPAGTPRLLRSALVRSLVLAVSLAACGGAGRAAEAPAAAGASAGDAPAGVPLYDRLGRRDAIAAVVHDFVANRVARDRRIRAYFQGVDTAGLEVKLVDQLCEISGGPCKYTGKDMKSAHAGMGVTEAELRAFLEDLQASLAQLGVLPREQTELLGLLAPMRDAIVTAK